METFPLPLLIFFVLLTLFGTWWFIYLKQYQVPYIIPDWFCGLALIIFGYNFMIFAGNIFHHFTDPPPSNLHLLVSGIIWIAFTVCVSIALDNSQKEIIKSL